MCNFAAGQSVKSQLGAHGSARYFILRLPAPSPAEVVATETAGAHSSRIRLGTLLTRECPTSFHGSVTHD